MDERAEQETVIGRLREQIASMLGWVKKRVQSNPLPSLLAVTLSLLLAW
jgi:hypothetical protein